jgi:membrane protein insertase Oxa1/YidC/SpoIIIJ
MLQDVIRLRHWTWQSIQRHVNNWCNDLSAQLPYNWNGTDYTAAGTYTFTTTNAAGCDSVATLNLAVNSTTTQQLMLRFVLPNYLITGMVLTILQQELIHSRQPMLQDVIRLRHWTWQSIQRPRQQLMLRFVPPITL